jgi:predicted ATPase
MATVSSKEAANAMEDLTKPPFLRRVRIRGYKSIGFCDVSLQPLTILVGRNAAGKSNFLGALSFLRHAMETNVTEAVKRHGGWSSMICRNAETSHLEMEIEAGFTWGRPYQRISVHDPLNGGSSKGESTSNLDGRRFVARYLLQVSGGEHVSPIIRREMLDLTDESGILVGGYDLQRGSADVPHLKSGKRKQNPLDPSEIESEDVLHWRRGLGIDISSKQADEVLSTQRHDHCLLALIGVQPFIDFADRIRSMGFYNVHPDAIRRLQKPLPGVFLEKDGSNLASVIRILDEIDPDSLQRVKEYLAHIAPEVIQLQVRQYGEYETIGFRLRAEVAGKPLEFDAASMSDGTLRALSTIMAAFQIVLPYGYPSVIGIEEPETALHPAAMRALVDALDDATQRTQVLVTTHSADLLSARDVSAGHVLVVRNRNGQTQITPVDPASREIIRKELYSLADLQRMDQLELDQADLERQAKAAAEGEEQ